MTHIFIILEVAVERQSASPDLLSDDVHDLFNPLLLGIRQDR